MNKLLAVTEKYYIVFLIPVLMLSAYNLFYCLGDTPIYSWDEARHGISAYEMLKRHDYIVNTYGYRNDYWNLKPPLSFWAIMLGYGIMGFNTMGLRLASVLAALLTILAVTFFTKYKHGETASLIAALVLAVSPKYIVIHSARTGDADSLFVLFFTASILSLLLSEHRIQWLYSSGFFFSLAFMTKSWHALSIAAIIFLYLLAAGRLLRLKPREVAAFVACSLAIPAVWAVLRYSRDGLAFLRTMVEYDLLSRSVTHLEGHIGGVMFYFNVLQTYYKIWLLLLVFCIFIYLVSYRSDIKELLVKKNGRYVIGMFLWLALPLTLFTIAKTKLGWYILPVYPPLAICTGAFCGVLLTGRRRSLLVQLVVLLLVAKGVTEYEQVIITHITVFKSDTGRVTFGNFKADRDIGGIRAYIGYTGTASLKYGPKSEFKDWRQSDMLSAELYWDIIPMSGGLKGFLEEEAGAAVIILPNNAETLENIRKYKLKVVGKSSSACILSK